MNTNQVAERLQSKSGLASRRGIIASLAGGLISAGIGANNVDDAASKKKGKRKKKRKNKKRNEKAKTRLDATCPGAGANGVTHPARDSRVAQTFTAVRSGPLVRATLPVTNDSDTAGDIVLRISPVDGSGLPTDEVLAETTAALDAPRDEIVELEFAFADPFSVVAGVEYALVLARPVGDDFVWRGDVGNPCGGDVAVSRDAAAPFTFIDDAEERDLIFTTFVTS